MKDLIEKIKSIVPLSKEAEEYFTSLGKRRAVDKGEVLIRQGQVVTKTYFVIEGCLRSYCTNTNGKEHTLLFAIKNWWISDYIALYNDQPAVLTVESLKESEVIAFNSDKIRDMFALFPELETFQRVNLERHVVSLQKRILNQLQLSASERYELFLEQYGDIEQHAANYHIASYLGITQESLSRIRVTKAKG